MDKESSRSDGKDLLDRLNRVLEELSRSNAPVRYEIVTHGTYETARGYLKLFAALGWIGVAVGAVVTFIALASSQRTYGASIFALPFGFALLVGGILTVVQSQAARAAVDSADYARQSLEIQALRHLSQSGHFEPLLDRR